MSVTSTRSRITTNPSAPTESRLAAFWERPYSRAVVIYMLGAVLALLPVTDGGDWTAALKRLLLVTASVVVYFGIVLLFNRPGRLAWLGTAIVGVTTVVAVLGTAQVNAEALRLTGLNYQVYSLLHRFLSFKGLPSVHQNVLGGFLVTFLPLAPALVLWEKRWWLRLYGLVCTLIITGAVLTTASRSAELGLTAIVFVLAFLLAARQPKIRLAIGAVVAVGVLGGIVYLSLNGLSGIENGVGRIDVWRTALAMWSDYPLTGAGLDQFPVRLPEYAVPSLAGTAQPHVHNLFLQGLVEFGLPGFVAIVISLVTTVRLLIAYNKPLKVAAPLRPVVAGAFAGMIACFVSGLLEYGNWGGKFAPAFWVLPALLAAAGLKLPSLKTSADRMVFLDRIKWQAWRKPAIAVGVVVGLFLLAPLALINVATLLTPAQPGAARTLYEISSVPAFFNATPLRDLGKLADGHTAGRTDNGSDGRTDNSSDGGNPETTQKYYRQAVERDPNDWQSLMSLGRIAEKTGQPDQAVLYYRQAGAQPYFMQAANKALAQNPPDYPTAENRLKTALAIDPRNGMATAALVQLYIKTDRKPEGLALLQNVLARYPSVALYEQAAGLASSPQEQLDLFQKANRLDPNNPNIYWEIGEAYRGLDQLDQAEKAYKQSLDLRPVFQWPVRSLAALYIKEGRNAEARALVEKFVSNNLFAEKPDREYVLLAQADANLGDQAASDAALAKAFQSNPESVPAYLFQGAARAKAGQTDQARAAYQKALQLDPNNDAAKQALAQLG